jgi:hypothetical protein
MTLFFAMDIVNLQLAHVPSPDNRGGKFHPPRLPANKDPPSSGTKRGRKFKLPISCLHLASISRFPIATQLFIVLYRPCNILLFNQLFP